MARMCAEKTVKGKVHDKVLTESCTQKGCAAQSGQLFRSPKQLGNNPRTTPVWQYRARFHSSSLRSACSAI
jgi:hypothetical protein